jgi:uncharacterized protein (DUF488 family)
MEFTICTIGFAGKTAEEFFALLSEAGVRMLVDVRENRGGQLSGYAKYPDLPFFLDRIGHITYSHEPRLAPTPEIRKAYRATKDWPKYESSFLELMRDREIPEAIELFKTEETIALLCSEPLPEKCHRRLVAELFAESNRARGHIVQIRHLIADKMKQSRPKQERRSG